MSIQVWKRQSWEKSYQTETLRGCCLGSIQIELVLGVGLFDLRETCNEQDVPDAHQLKVALELS
ncbi:9019_t:CDS:1, partial [Paraglomus brasilianum]